MDSSIITALAHKARGPGSRPGQQDRIFLFQFYNYPRGALVVKTVIDYNTLYMHLVLNLPLDGIVIDHFHSEQSSFSNLSVTSPMSQLILQPFRRFAYVTARSQTLPLLHLCHSSFSNPSFASPTSQALHLIHLASRPWSTIIALGIFLLVINSRFDCEVL